MRFITFETLVTGVRAFECAFSVRTSSFVHGLMTRRAVFGEGLGLLETGLGCTLPESQQEGGLSVGAVGPQGASRWRDYPRPSARARSFVL